MTVFDNLFHILLMDTLKHNMKANKQTSKETNKKTNKQRGDPSSYLSILLSSSWMTLTSGGCSSASGLDWA